MTSSFLGSRASAALACPFAALLWAAGCSSDPAPSPQGTTAGSGGLGGGGSSGSGVQTSGSSSGGTSSAGGSTGSSGAAGSVSNASGQGAGGSATPLGGSGGSAAGGSQGGEQASAGSSGSSNGGGAGGGSAGPSIAIDPSRMNRQDIDFTPVAADAGAHTWHGQQRGSFDGSKSVQAKLVVTMGGIGNGAHTGGVYQYAVGRGFHAFAVDMYNSEGGESNQGKVYLESWSGQDLTPVANVTPTDGVQNRIKKALAYLNGVDPGADWDFYLDAQGEVRWQDVILFGYSYGGQVALAATKYVAPFRVLLTASPTLPDDASWLTTMPTVADLSKCFAINSAGDTEHWEKLMDAGWPGMPQTVMDGGYAMVMQPPFMGTSMIQAPGGHTEFCSVAGNRYDVICDFMFAVKP